MPLRTEAVTLADELKRLLDEREELADDVASIDAENPAHDRLVAEGRTLDNHIAGVEWAADEWDVDTVTFAGLTGGEYGRVEDRVKSDSLANGQQSVGGAARIHMVASGTVEAPYVDGVDSYEQKLAAVSQLPFQYLQWAQSRVDELTSVGNDDETSFSDLVKEKKAGTSSGT